MALYFSIGFGRTKGVNLYAVETPLHSYSQTQVFCTYAPFWLKGDQDLRNNSPPLVLDHFGTIGKNIFVTLNTSVNKTKL